MTKILPDCMMPDGADPCLGYQQIVAERDQLFKAVDTAIDQICDVTTQRLLDEYTHGNVMGRIAVALFGDQNNRTDEECVAEAAKIGYGLTGARLRIEKLEARMAAMVRWLEKNEPSVWKRGIWDAINDGDPRPCTCHPDDRPPVPCPGKFALAECWNAALREAQAERDALRALLTVEQQLSLHRDPFLCAEPDCCSYQKPVSVGACLCRNDMLRAHRVKVAKALRKGEGK